MTVAAQSPTISYIEDGSSVAFAVPFRYDSPADLRAVRRSADGTETALVNGTDFTASDGPTNSGGTLTLGAAGAAGSRLTIFRQTARTQTADYIEAGAFTAESHERALDKGTLIDQEQDQDIGRAVKVPVGEAGLELAPFEQRASRVFTFDSEGRALAMPVAELAVLVSGEKPAGITEVFTQSFGPRSQVIVMHEDGVGEGGYYVEIAPAASINFTRAYAWVFGGTGICDVQVLGGGLLWQATGVSSMPVDEVVDVTLPAGFNLVVVLENIVGTVTGVVVFLEGAAE